MHNSIRLFIIKSLQGIIEILILFPFLLIFGIYFVSEELLWVWISSFAVMLCLGVAFRLQTIDKKVWVYLLFSVILAALQSFIIVDSILVRVFTFVIGAACTYRGVMYAERPRSVLFPIPYMWVTGLPVYIVSYLLFRFVDPLTPFINAIAWIGFAVLATILFVANGEHLKAATLSKRDKPFIGKAMQRQNRIFIFVTLLVAVMITNLNVIQASLYQMLTNTIKSIIWFMSLFGGEDPPPTPQQPNEQSFAGMPEAEEPSLLAVWLERIMYVVVAVGLVILFFVLVYMLYRRFRRIIQRVYNWLAMLLNKVFGHNNNEEKVQVYVDEKESIINWKDWRNKNKERAKDVLANVFKRSIKWDNLTTKEKIRHVYRQMIVNQTKKGYAAKAHFTPKETMIELEGKIPGKEKEMVLLEQAYQEARYGSRVNKDVKVEDFSSLMDR